MTEDRSKQLFDRACAHIPGGVNSPVRAFRAVGGRPRFVKRADGPYIWDVDGNRYLDFVGSWGPMLLGHNHPEIRKAVVHAAEGGLSFGAATEQEVDMAELLCEIMPSLEMVRMVNSGTEAVMSALRVARGYTGRDKLIKFEGCYHGHCDAMLVKAGSGVMTAGVPDSAGVPKGVAEDTLTAQYNNLESVKALFIENPKEIAAVIVEPVAANMGVVPPQEGFLEGLRQLCDQYGALLIFDEVITGFRLGLTGAQGYYNVTPDLTTFGKIIGAGMPVGAYGGKKEYMQMVAPLGTVYQAGTLSGNPIAMAAGIKQLTLLQQNTHVYAHMTALQQKLCAGFHEILVETGAPCTVNGVGSLACLFFTREPVVDYQTAKTADTALFGRFFGYMLEHGIYLAPSQFEAIFLSNAHSDAHVDEVLTAARTFFKGI